MNSGKRDKDIIEKCKGKQIADKRRGAKEIDTEVGEKELLKNVVFPNKHTSNFDKTQFNVLERQNIIVEIEGGDTKNNKKCFTYQKGSNQTYRASCPTPQSDVGLPETLDTNDR